MRSIAILAATIALAGTIPGAFAPAASAATRPTATASPPTHVVNGGGIGTFDGTDEQKDWDGNYSSDSQLGNGRFHFGNGVVDNSLRLTRSDGAVLQGPLADSHDCGALEPGDVCKAATLAGAADISIARVALTIRDTPRPRADDPFAGTTAFLMRGTLNVRRTIGYVMLGTNGTTYAFGGVAHRGDAQTQDAVDIDVIPAHDGAYWVVDATGQVFAFNGAPYYGSAHLTDDRVTSMSAAPGAQGYLLFTAKGRAIPFGDAPFSGDMHTTHLNGGIVGSVITPSGSGYYMVGADGGVFAFGDAKFHGSTGNLRLNQPVVGLVPTSDGRGYWLVASDGGVFSFNAPFLGSMGGTELNRPVVSMVRYGDGYLMVASDGGIFDFSTAPFFGSLAETHLTAPVVNAAAVG